MASWDFLSNFTRWPNIGIKCSRSTLIIQLAIWWDPRRLLASTVPWWEYDLKPRDPRLPRTFLVSLQISPRFILYLVSNLMIKPSGVQVMKDKHWVERIWRFIFNVICLHAWRMRQQAAFLSQLSLPATMYLGQVYYAALFLWGVGPAVLMGTNIIQINMGPPTKTNFRSLMALWILHCKLLQESYANLWINWPTMACPFLTSLDLQIVHMVHMFVFFSVLRDVGLWKIVHICL